MHERISAPQDISGLSMGENRSPANRLGSGRGAGSDTASGSAATQKVTAQVGLAQSVWRNCQNKVAEAEARRMEIARRMAALAMELGAEPLPGRAGRWALRSSCCTAIFVLTAD